MKTMLDTISGIYGAVRLDLSEPRADANLAEHRPGLFDLLSAWEERARFRHELAIRARETPHLIGDIGLTMDQVRDELAKPLWRR
ncbi:hypothetical protein EN828_18720 [Mesorhizobium sp. M2D.F.Ca.ET.185.01.1.1]|uniref:hypothetical protein n=1 Tax=unclassified Mesorhizobium TaxID=325217 RepID=UPI000FCC2B7C|nr:MULTISPECIES: hypothetical protein [unclassified Mesorhizobium]TGP79456.1 hypothetical protein EN870_15040 [bacterium M00.F.Ca.ET.227.01.1.1]TGQ00805.1 hypothetical protein EN864_02195 [bacterium M00.F.Ca.ET.221.01.1.1]TGQ02674.1 hypothetical protein EN865_01710 [bacterium M00.F.Ca.ET.222.01.1.1]TGU12568.1 hypothetical protein EN806_19470 [bacterium M00.F.Ca.ET.163.01.1.1]TGU34540.1 hypothetical protein EN799_21605 [bacterium M00.F.Ca.ET.156.01.1.1]TGU46504.1 hypothetical protein EN789_163